MDALQCVQCVSDVVTDFCHQKGYKEQVGQRHGTPVHPKVLGKLKQESGGVSMGYLGCRDVSAVKSMYYSFKRTQIQFPAPKSMAHNLL